MRNKNIIIRRVENDKELEQYYDIRWTILRKPLGMPKGSEKSPKEKNSIHLIALINDSIVATGMLVPITKDKAQVRQIAVLPQYRKMGIGSKILGGLKEKAQEENFKELFLNARVEALDFYLKNGYEEVLDSDHIELGIPHKRMCIRL